MLLELLLGIVIGLLVLCTGLLGWLLRRSGHDALLRVTARLEALRESQERVTRAVVDEIGFARREAAQLADEQRGEQVRALEGLRDALLEALASDAELHKRPLAELTSRIDARAQHDEAALRQLVQIVRHDLRAAHEASAALQTERDEALAASARASLAELQRAQAELASALDALRVRFEESALGSFQDDCARRLERIRHAAEERLPATLEQRLADGLRPTNLRIDEIGRVLDELRALATHPGP